MPPDHAREHSEQVVSPKDEVTAPVSPSIPGAPTIALGVDLIERTRVLAVYERHGQRFMRRVFTETERQQADQRIERLVGRFAAKEACAKALGTGIGQIAWREIEIIRQPGGKPRLLLHGAAAARAAQLGLIHFDVSISDTHDHALAVVVGVGLA